MEKDDKLAVSRPNSHHHAHQHVGGGFKCTRLFFLTLLVIAGIWATIQLSAFHMMMLHAENYVESIMEDVDEHGDFAFLKLLASSKSQPKNWLVGRLQAQNRKVSEHEEKRRKWRNLMGGNDAELEANNVLLHPIVHQDVNITWRSNPPKFILLKSLVGRGTGNLLNGLLAAHLLGEEFGRIVCISKAQFPMFHEAFTYVHPMAVQHCPTLYATEDHAEILANFSQANLQSINFGPRPPNECLIKEILESDVDIVNLQSNVYPRWPVVPRQFFFKYYYPQPTLLKMLPFESQQQPQQEPTLGKKKIPPPKTVVHLRFPDSELDIREGLEMGSLEALGSVLPTGPSTYLTTNLVEMYDYFETKFNWSHPNWQLVKHSAIADFEWGLPLEHNYYEDVAKPPQAVIMLELFADWYTLLIAHRVIHTRSEFSQSAIHWMGTVSRTYNGIDRKHSNDLIVLEEDWIRSGEMSRLIDRTPEEIQCNATWPPTPAPTAFEEGDSESSSKEEKDAKEGAAQGKEKKGGVDEKKKKPEKAAKKNDAGRVDDKAKQLRDEAKGASVQAQ